MKSHFEVFSMFKKFCANMKTQFGISIRALHSNNAKEYFSSSFRDFLSQSYSSISCLYRPQQNRIVGCKHKYLLEVARTIFIHMKAPKYLFGDAVLIAYYLINCMP